MKETLDGLLACTDPVRGISWHWPAWRREIRPVLADYLAGLSDDRAELIRTIELTQRHAVMGHGDPPGWDGHQRIGISGVGSTGVHAQYWHDRIELPADWEITGVVATVRGPLEWPSSRLIVATGAGASWPATSSILRVATYRHGVPAGIRFSTPLRARNTVIVGLPDRAAPPTDVMVEFEFRGRPYHCYFVLSSPGVVERLSIVESLTERPP